MGQQFIVSGYIECFSEKDAQTKAILKCFDFELNTPFPNIFSEPRMGYQGSMVSFAGSFNNFDEDLEQWRAKFEDLLRKLCVKTASVRVESELGGDFVKISYVPASPIYATENGKIESEWVRFTENESGETKEEKLLI